MIRIEDDLIWSDAAEATARQVGAGWVLSWAPERIVDRAVARWAMELADSPPIRFRESQLAGAAALTFWQVMRANHLGLVPEPDGVDETGNRFWLPETVRAFVAASAKVAAEVGSVPDIGARRAASELSHRLGFTVTADAVVELHRRGLLPVVGQYERHNLYCGRTIEAFDDAVAVAEAAVDGQMLTDTEAAEFLELREVDFRHLVRAGIARPVPWDERLRSSAPWRTGDLELIEAAHPEIDWAAVRATEKGRRSALAALPTATARSA